MIHFILSYFIQFYELILHIREQHSPGSSAAESVTQWVKSCFKVISWEMTDHLRHKNSNLFSMSWIKCPCGGVFHARATCRFLRVHPAEAHFSHCEWGIWHAERVSERSLEEVGLQAGRWWSVTFITVETPPFLFSSSQASHGSAPLSYQLFWFQHSSVG